MCRQGMAFAVLVAKKLLVLLQDRARELGVEMRFETEVGSAEDYRREFDVVVASDGLNSRTRAQYAKTFQPETDQRLCQFVWLGTRQKFSDAFTFIFEETEHGWVWAHAYQFDDDTATFIIECSQDTFDKFGFGEMSQQDSIKICEDIFKNHLQGHSLMTNATHIRGSAWLRFPRVLCKKWYHENIVLLGDASATAHFSIGSGTKLALESAVALAEHIHSEDNLQNAFERYQEDRLLEVLRLQSAARNSLEWFEQVERYLALDPVQLNYSMLTRSQRISHENLRERDPEWLQSAERWFMNKAGMPKDIPVQRPMFAPFRLRDMELKNRIVVSPMAQYMAQDGIPNDWHLSHYGERAKGGAALVYTEMTCVSAVGRITPGCPGLYSPKHEKGWKKLTNFVHDFTEAKICCQIGHSGRKGSTNIGWEGMDKPLASGNWDVVSASAIPWSQDNATPREITKTEMDEVRDQFVASAQMADRAGFDMIELHAAHGYLISSFISPVSNTRRDAYGGSLEKRMSYPLEVFSAMRAAWPKAKPMSVRISANDWVGDAGVTPQEAVDIARLFADAGADLIDVSAGQTTTDANPVYGRMFQTPFSDRIRNDAGLKTMAVGNIYEADHANSILMAGRADLIAVGRPHLNDPYWTLHEGTKVGDRQAVWPRPYEAGRDQAWRLADREAEMVRP
jgi:anthraniloyl-CoA monooxygenase